jgi:hypothetical protein
MAESQESKIVLEGNIDLFKRPRKNLKLSFVLFITYFVTQRRSLFYLH